MSHKIEAYRDLLRRYREIFGYFWKNRRDLDGGKRNALEAEFLPAALSLREKPVSPVGRLVAGTLTALLALLLAWSVAGKIDIIVNAPGRIVPSSRTKTIGSVEVASVRAIHVREGQAVKEGDLLVELDAGAPDAERDKAVGDKIEALLQIARSRALIGAVDSGKAPRLPRMEEAAAEKREAAQMHLDGQYRDFRAKLERLDGQIRRYSRALPLAARQASDYGELARDHDVAIHAFLEKEQARIEVEGQLAEARSERAALIAETRKTAFDAITEAIKIVGDSQEDALRADSHSRLLKLTAPVDGTVQQLTVHTVGGVVPAAQPLMAIVPVETAVEIEARVENRDIGFLEEGQPAEVKIDAFEYTRYGVVSGRVTHVSRDAIQEDKKDVSDKDEDKQEGGGASLVYSITILLDKATIAVDGRDAPLTPGLSVNAEIKTGARRVIEYVLSPLIRHGRESLHER
jgi:hemolysin D